MYISFLTSSTLFVRYHTSSETNNLATTSQGYACGEALPAYGKYFISFSMHCTVCHYVGLAKLVK